MSTLPLISLQAAFCLLPSVAPAQAAAPARESLAIVGARIEVGDGKVIPVGTIVIQDGKIVSVSEGTESPAGVPTLNASGKVIYPGFIDAFSTRGIKAPPNPPANANDGRPAVNANAPAFMWPGNRKGVTPDFKASENLEIDDHSTAYAAGFTTAMLSPSRGSIRGVATVIDLLPASVEGRVLQPSAGIGMSFRSGAGPGYPTNILGVIALMRQSLYDAKSVGEGVNLAPGAEKAPDWVAGPETLKDLVSGKVPAYFEVSLDREIMRAFNLADEFGFDVKIVGARDAYLILDEIKARKPALALNPGLGNAPTVSDPSPNTPPADVTPREVLQERYDRWALQSRNAIKLAEAGVPFAWYSEGEPISDFLKNVRAQVKNGLPREAALKALTVNGAEFLGLKDLGTLAAGKRANLVLMSGDFAADTSTVERVWVDGRPVLAPKPAATSTEARR